MIRNEKRNVSDPFGCLWLDPFGWALRFGAGIALAGITASRANASDLLPDFGTDRLLIEQGFSWAAESLELADGKKHSYSQFVGRTGKSRRLRDGKLGLRADNNVQWR